MNVDLHARVRSFLAQLLVDGGDGDTFDDDEPLFSSGRLDSLAAIKAVAYVEGIFDTDFTATEFSIRQIDSVSSILRLADAAPAPVLAPRERY
jgi:acyl carrier protein